MARWNSRLPRRLSGLASEHRHRLRLLGAALFGASTPIAKLLIGEIGPVILAGLLYAGSGWGSACG